MNLIICCTPLQVLIAKKIIELFPNEKFYGVVLYPVYNEKYVYYSNQLKEVTCDLLLLKDVYPSFKNFYKWIKNYLTIKKTFRNREFDKIFMANINSYTISSVMNSIIFKECYTFDDGTVNILGGLLNESKNYKLLSRLLGNKYPIKTILSISRVHFTIYNIRPNIIDNTFYLRLFDSDSNYRKEGVTKIANIFVGQPIYEAVKNKFNDIEQARRFVRELMIDFIISYNIDLYYPHPRENDMRLFDLLGDRVKLIESPLIFEDYLLEQITKNPNIEYRIYTFFSSVVLNVKDFPNVKVFAIKSKIFEDFSALYDVFLESGCEVISYDKV